MLTCVNPDVTFKRKNGLRTKGVAVALRYLEGLMLKYGLCVPSSDSIRRDLNLDIGETRKVKQVFNRHADDERITRASSGVEVEFKSCVVVKRGAFSEQSWQLFSKGKNFL